VNQKQARDAGEGLTERAGDKEARATKKRRSGGGVEVARHVDDAAMLLPRLEGGHIAIAIARAQHGGSSDGRSRLSRRRLHGVPGGEGRGGGDEQNWFNDRGVLAAGLEGGKRAPQSALQICKTTRLDLCRAYDREISIPIDTPFCNLISDKNPNLYFW
jgi:hypothetical protein